MSSFTENPTLALSPYVPKVNVDTYAQVGMYKQNQYNQGYAKIQGAIDNVAGLDVYGDHRKQYLENKVNELNTHLKSIAGADLSNQQLINQVGAFASHIANDPNIQQSVAAAHQIKSYYKDANTLKQKHPELYTEQNQWYDTRQIEAYANNPDVGAIYNGPREATRYADYDEPIRKALKDLSPTVSYKSGANGRYEYVIDKSSTITPTQVEQVIEGVLSSHPEYKKQVQINGAYAYKDYTPDQLDHHMNSLTTDVITELHNKNEFYKQQKAKDPSNPIKNANADEQIQGNTEIINKLSEVKKGYDDVLKNYGVEAAKEYLYNSNFKYNYINNYQKDNHELEIKENIGNVQADKHWLDYVKEGVDPNTRMPLKPGDPLWEISQTASGKTNYATNRVVVGQPSGETYASDKNTKMIEDLTSKSKEELATLRKDYINAYFNGIASKDNLKAFDNYVAEQEKHINLGDGQGDPLYLGYKENSKKTQVQLKSLTDLKTAAETYGAEQVKLPDQNFVIKDKYGTITINPSQHINFINKLKDINNYIQEHAQVEGGTSSTGISTGYTSKKEYEKAQQEIFDKYKNDPDYELLKRIYSQNLQTEIAKTVINPYDEAISKRRQAVNEYYTNQGKTLNPEGINVQGNPKLEKEVEGLAKNAYTAAHPDSKSFPKNFEVLNTYYDSKGLPHVQYVADGVREDSPLTTSGELSFMKRDPYDWAENAIEYSPAKQLTTTSSNGKITYSVGKDSYGSYSLYLLNNGNRIRIPTPQPLISAGNAISQIEDFANAKNGDGSPMTSQQIIETIQNEYLNR